MSTGSCERCGNTGQSNLRFSGLSSEENSGDKHVFFQWPCQNKKNQYYLILFFYLCESFLLYNCSTGKSLSIYYFPYLFYKHILWYVENKTKEKHYLSNVGAAVGDLALVSLGRAGFHVLSSWAEFVKLMINLANSTLPPSAALQPACHGPKTYQRKWPVAPRNIADSSHAQENIFFPGLTDSPRNPGQV